MTSIFETVSILAMSIIFVIAPYAFDFSWKQAEHSKAIDIPGYYN